MSYWDEIVHFKPSEFGDGSKMQEVFVRKLDNLREIMKIPLVVTSGYRSPDHNATVGGAEDSAHLYGWAADLRALSPWTRSEIVHIARSMGITRIAVGDTIVHLDMMPGRTAGLWHYHPGEPGHWY